MYLPSFFNCSTFSFSLCFLSALASSLRFFSSSSSRSSASSLAFSSASARAISSSLFLRSSCCFWSAARAGLSFFFLPPAAGAASEAGDGADGAAAGSGLDSAGFAGSAFAGPVAFFFAALRVVLVYVSTSSHEACQKRTNSFFRCFSFSFFSFSFSALVFTRGAPSAGLSDVASTGSSTGSSTFAAAAPPLPFFLP
jgi:hypothetical protein